MFMQLCKIITGSPVYHIAVGSAALIRQGDKLTKTTPVTMMHRMSASEIWFETVHTRYVLRVLPVRGGDMAV